MAGRELHNSDGTTVHLDEDGVPCTRHILAASAGILQLATVGSRALSSHHDMASRLQSLMMAVEELDDLTAGSPQSGQLRVAVETAHTALVQLNEMFAATRAFARGSERVRISLAGMLTRAARRAGVMIDVTTLGDVELNVAAAMVEHAFSLLIEVLGADLGSYRRVMATVELPGTEVVLTLVGAGPGTPRVQTADLIMIASHAIARDHGEVRCGRPGESERFVIRFPA